MSPLTCPVCERSDLLQKIGPIIDAGTTDSDAQITGIATGWNVGFASLSGVNVSRLASRLSGPYTPTLSALQNYSIGFFVSFIVSLHWSPDLVNKTGIDYFLGYQKEALIVSAFLSLIFALILKLPVQTFFNLTFLRSSRQSWQRNKQILRSQYYCLRDDVIVHEGEGYDVDSYMEWRFKQP
jgi:hypothetical protein